MPLFDGSNEAHWDAHYTWSARPGRNGVDLNMYAERWADIEDYLTQAHGTFDLSNRILIGGAGRGHLVEAAHNAGRPNCWGIDGSSILGQGRFTLANGVLLVDRPMQGGGGTLARLRQVTGDDEFALVVTEDLLNCYDPVAELSVINDILDACEFVLEPGQPTSNIIHYLHTPDPGWDLVAAPMANLTAAEWEAIRPSHTWLVF